jgi:hypothetical protein
MSNEEPRQLRLDCDVIHALAQRYSPVLRFHEQERFYPALAEAYLSHVTEAPWTSDPAHHLGDLPPDPHRRGAALCEFTRLYVDTFKPALHVLAGQPVGGDRPLQLTTDDGDPYAIGRRELRSVNRDVFIDLAGWLDLDLSAGDIDRIYGLFSELAAAFNPNDAWQPLAGSGDLPHAWIPQPVNPTTYCEVRWAREFPEISDGGGLKDFPKGDGHLQSFLALTYHYLYPAREPGIDGVGYRLEGQWEAVTLFFRGEGDRSGGIVLDRPEHIVVSQGVDQAGNYHRTAYRAWSDAAVSKLGDHPVLYVSRGTHRFFFEPVTNQTSDPHAGQKDKPGADPGAHKDDREEGPINDFLVLGLVLLALAALLAATVLLAILLLLLALWLLFEWLKSLFASGDNDDSGDPIPASEGNDEANDEGTQAGGDGSEDPAPPAPGGSGSGPFGLPNTGSPTGRATAFFDVRVVDRVFLTPEETTGYPSRRPCESPTWWEYSGGWGVRVVNGFGTGWRNGTRRIDEHGRSWAYWNGLRLSNVLHGGNPED